MANGFRTENNIDRISNIASKLKDKIGIFDECWCAVGSGTLIKGLMKSGLANKYYGLCVYHVCPEMSGAIGKFPTLPIDEPVRPEASPPYPSSVHYDAKLWSYAIARKGRILVWNVM